MKVISYLYVRRYNIINEKYLPFLNFSDIIKKYSTKGEKI